MIIVSDEQQFALPLAHRQLLAVEPVVSEPVPKSFVGQELEPATQTKVFRMTTSRR